MTSYLKNPLTYAWAFLAAITVLSWGLTRSSAVAIEPDVVLTVSVLIMAAIKVQLVVRYFMEVRHAPRWLKWTTDGWLWGLTALMTIFYLIRF